ncbi:hypothetical protein FGIG_04143 [Fasciola gigantica]|uniref:X-ray radiation resistance-associated protein 1 n=1 Tax=Fasciola gigantica TaxID=46835 RepID=A0A504YAZ8_FASGI|nr:hypothetical protein FGIG_04143 [Fasciola gigantica]
MPGGYFPPRSLIKEKPGVGKWVRLFDGNSNQERPSQKNRSSPASKIYQEDGLLSFSLLTKKYASGSPGDLYEINISGMDLEDGPTECLSEFSSVVKVDASDNMLTMLIFQHFPRLRELNLSLNQIYRVPDPKSNFSSLECLDLSFNFLDGPSFLKLGLLPALTRLYVSGNGIHCLPPELAGPRMSLKETTAPRFSKLEVLHLDDNKLSKAEDIASLATLPKLRILNLANNRFRTVPLLKSVPSDINTDDEEESIQSQPSSSVTHQPLRKLKSGSNFSSNGTVETLSSGIQIKGKKMSFSNSSKSLTQELSVVYPAVPTTTERSSFVAGKQVSDSGTLEAVTEKMKVPDRYDMTKIRKSSHNQYRNLRPRIRIVDEFFGLGKVKKIMNSSDAVHRPSVQVRPPGSDTMHPVPLSALRRISGEMNRSGLRRRLSEEQHVLKRMTSSAAMTALKEATNSVFATPPFPCLELLDLSYNLIMYEQHILPVAVWPQLRELVVHNNPVVSRHSGVPPLLQQLLVERLHLNVRRTVQAVSWFNDQGQLIYPAERKSGSNTKETRDPNKALVLPEPLVTRPDATSSTRQILNANQTKTRQLAGKMKRGGRLLVPTRLPSAQLIAPPKPSRCSPDRMLREYRETVTHSVGLVQFSDSSSTSSTGLSNRSEGKISGQPKSVQCASIRSEEHSAYNQAASVTAEPKYSTDDLDPSNDECSSFFTTQLAQFDANRSLGTEDKSASGSLYTVPEDQLPMDGNMDTIVPTNPGPLLPDLEWLVDETSLPETMQACLRELRYLCQHRPLVHKNTHNKCSSHLTNSELQAINPAGSDQSKLVPKESQTVLPNPSKTISDDPIGTETGPGNDIRELSLLDTIPKLQYTSMLAIYLPKAMEWKTQSATPNYPVSNIEEREKVAMNKEKRGSAKPVKTSKGTAQLAKNKFTKFERSHEQLLDKIVTQANDHVAENYDRMAVQLRRDIVESLESAHLPISINKLGESLLPSGIMR